MNVNDIRNELANMQADFDRMPYDCPARAAERMRVCYSSGRDCNIIDLRIVLGDPSRNVTICDNPMTMTKGLLNCNLNE